LKVKVFFLDFVQSSTNHLFCSDVEEGVGALIGVTQQDGFLVNVELLTATGAWFIF
jgi:hypothetical protein